MRKNNIKRQGYATRICGLLAGAMMMPFALTSCVMDNGDCPNGGRDSGYNINLSIAAGALNTRTGGHSYADSTADENFIDIERSDFAIFIFDEEGNFVERFWPTDTSVRDDFDAPEPVYLISGVYTPDKKNPLSKIKMGIMVNWRTIGGDYNFNLAGKTLNDIYGDAGSLVYTLPVSVENGYNMSWTPAKGSRGIPMFGLSADIDLDQVRTGGVISSIPTLRSVAKVEILDKVPGAAGVTDVSPANIERCVLTSYNANGRFIPDGRDTATGNPKWSERDTQVVNPSIPSTPGKSANLDFVRTKRTVSINDTDESRDCLVAYIPEMDLSTLSAKDDSRPVILVYVKGSDTPYTIELSEYGTNGKPKPREDDPTEYDFYKALLRNHIYQYSIISIGLETELVVTTGDWDVDEDQIWDYEDAQTTPKSFEWTDSEGNEWSAWDNSDINDIKRILLIGSNDSDAAYGRFLLTTGEHNPATWNLSLVPDDETKNDHFKIEVKNAAGEWTSYGEKGDFYTAAVDNKLVEFRIIATAQNTGSINYTARVVMTLTTFDGRVSNLKLTANSEVRPTEDKFYYQVKQVSNGGDNM